MERKMNVEIIKQAILNEVEGYQFYKLYSEKIVDADVVRIFMTIAEEELKHIDFLRRLTSGNDQDRLDLATVDVPAPGIFKFSSLTPEDLSLAVSAFSIAMKLEDESQKFYDDAARSAETEEEKALYILLRDWEISHRDTFKNHYDELREEWWADNSYHPF